MQSGEILLDNDDNVSFDYKTRRLMEERSNFSAKCNISDYDINGENPTVQFNVSDEQLKGRIESTNLSNHFFSQCNIDHIQKLIIANAAHLSNNKYKIGKQSEQSIKNVMKDVYLSYSNNTICDKEVINEVNRLNNILIEKIMPTLMSNITQYFKYLEKINNPMEVIEHSVNVNTSENHMQMEHPYLRKE